VAESWKPRLGALAERDLDDIFRWSEEAFGIRQAHLYQNMIFQAVAALRLGPEAPGSRAREEIGPGYRTLHVARRGRHARHLLLYRMVDN